MKYDVFISYRREDSLAQATAVYVYLVEKKFNVSFDLDNLGGGDFNEQLLERIEECKDFIVIVDEHTFDRCREKENESDWLKKELSHALKKGKHIIPVVFDGVDIKTAFRDLPDDIKEVTNKQIVVISKNYSLVSFEKIVEFLKTNKFKKTRKRTISFLGVIIAFLVVASAMMFFGKKLPNDNHVKENQEIIVFGSGTVCNYFETEIKDKQQKNIDNIFFLPLSSFDATILLSDQGFVDKIKEKNLIFATSKEATDKDFGEKEDLVRNGVQNILELFLAKDTLYIRTSYLREYIENNKHVISGDTLKIRENEVETFLKPYIKSGNTLFTTRHNSGTYKSYQEFVKRINSLSQIQYFKNDAVSKFQKKKYFMLTRKYYDPLDKIGGSIKIFIIDSLLKCKEESLFLYIPVFKINDHKLIIPESVQNMIKQQCGIDTINFNNVEPQSSNILIKYNDWVKKINNHGNTF